MPMYEIDFSPIKTPLDELKRRREAAFRLEV
jgi:hypothetical protein